MTHTLTLSDCMDIFDWFDDNTFEYIRHIIRSKIDGEQRVKRSLPELRKRAVWLIRIHEGTDSAYPTELLNRPA